MSDSSRHHHQYTDSSQMTDDMVNQAVLEDQQQNSNDAMNIDEVTDQTNSQTTTDANNNTFEQPQSEIGNTKVPASSFSKLARLQQQEPEYDQLDIRELDGEVFEIQRKYQLEAIRGQVCLLNCKSHH